MTHMLFLTPMDLWRFVQDNGTLDNLFGLGGVAISAALKDFKKGFFDELDSSVSNWQGDYLEVMHLISHMRDDPARREWLDNLQRKIMVKGWAGLLPTHNFFV